MLRLRESAKITKPCARITSNGFGSRYYNTQFESGQVQTIPIRGVVVASHNREDACQINEVCEAPENWFTRSKGLMDTSVVLTIASAALNATTFMVTEQMADRIAGIPPLESMVEEARLALAFARHDQFNR